ncbi:MAG: hypothetical protein NTU88_09295, partial [Armatimonadetes bacterium]|nr:hypothetical protein [Armatimonadota bacterium]
MRRIACIVLFTVLAALSLSSVGSAWDISYEGDVMPNSETLGSSKWAVWVWPGGLAQMSSDGSALHMVDSRTVGYTYCYREDAY